MPLQAILRDPPFFPLSRPQYPFTSVFGLFWYIVPPYVAVTGLFPFTLNAINAAIGSLFLKCFEFGAVSKLQAATVRATRLSKPVPRVPLCRLQCVLRADYLFSGQVTSFASNKTDTSNHISQLADAQIGVPTKRTAVRQVPQ